MTTANDAAAYKLIYDSRAERLRTASTRAEKWSAGLTALVTVLTTAMVVKGPENFAKAEGSVRALVLLFVVAGALGVAVGLVCAYSAAFGGLYRKSHLDALIDDPPTIVTNASESLESAVPHDARTSRNYLRAALAATCVGMVSLTAAIAFSWFATAKPDAGKGTSRIEVNGKTVVLDGEFSVRSGAVTFVECPD